MLPHVEDVVFLDQGLQWTEQDHRLRAGHPESRSMPPGGMNVI